RTVENSNAFPLTPSQCEKRANVVRLDTKVGRRASAQARVVGGSVPEPQLEKSPSAQHAEYTDREEREGDGGESGRRSDRRGGRGFDAGAFPAGHVAAIERKIARPIAAEVVGAEKPGGALRCVAATSALGNSRRCRCAGCRGRVRRCAGWRRGRGDRRRRGGRL